MNWLEATSMALFLGGLLLAVVGWRYTYYRHQPFTVTPWFFPTGIFVWGDAVIIGIFWSLLGICAYLLGDWSFVGLGISLFWLVRAWGEVQYWLHEQFATKHRNPPHTLHFHRFFPDESIWFVYQVFWQCVMVAALLAACWFGKQWLF